MESPSPSLVVTLVPFGFAAIVAVVGQLLILPLGLAIMRKNLEHGDAEHTHAREPTGDIESWAAWVSDLVQSFSLALLPTLGLVLVHTQDIAVSTVVIYLTVVGMGMVLFALVVLRGVHNEPMSEPRFAQLPTVPLASVVLNVLAMIVVALTLE